MDTSSSAKKKTLTDYEKKLLAFYGMCFVCEATKVAIYFVIFYLLGLTKQFIAALIFMAMLRISGGGLHFKHYLSCLFVSFLLLGLAILSGIYIKLPLPFMLLLSLGCLIAAYKLVPIQAPTRPDATEQLIQSSKRHTAIKILLIIALICIRPKNLYVNIGFWTLVIHVVQLAIAKERRK